MDQIKKFVRVPTGAERAGLRFIVADNTRNQQVGIVKRGPKACDSEYPVRLPRESPPESPAQRDLVCRQGTRTV